MTEEIKHEHDEKKCVAGKLKKFTLIAGAVFVGATLAILLSASILRPKCPCPRGMMMPPPGMERQMMPPAHHGQFKAPHDNARGAGAHRPDFQAHRPGAEQGPRIDENFKKQDAPKPLQADKTP